MPCDLILGTAGHIDHGKTSLIKALTGIDCDRLPEEKARGITIDIGFAHLEVGEYRLGIVDVPGHERFVRNMLAGATGIDLALLVVAADDSVMPQTREHLAILKLLGIRHGLVALTKVDLVDATTREVALMEVRELLQGTFLEDAPIVPTSVVTGEGLDRLKVELERLCAQVNVPDQQHWFRLPIDRAFVVQGHGTVVTGSVPSGQVRVGDELEWHRGDGVVERVRVRGLTNHGRPVPEVHRGQRAGINLAGVPHEAVHRGQELFTPGYLRPSRVLSVRVEATTFHTRGLRHRLSCRVHVGTAEVMGTLTLLDTDTVQPGTTALAQLFLEHPVTTVWGQPFVLRDAAATRTLGGGRVLQPVARKIRRRHIDMIEQLEKLESAEPSQRLAAVAWFAGLEGIDGTTGVRDAGIAPSQIQTLQEQLQRAGTLIALTLPNGRYRLLHAQRIEEAEQRVLTLVMNLHQQQPLLTSLDRQKVVAQLGSLGEADLVQALIDRLLAHRQLVGDAHRIAHAQFKPRLSVNQRKLKDRIVAAHQAAPFQPPEPKDFVSQAGGNAHALKDIYEVAVAEGLLVHISDQLYLAAEAEAEMRRRILARLQQGGGLTVAEIRDLLGTTRKYAVPLCEYLDRIGLTRRDGDLRYLAETPSEAAAQRPSETLRIAPTSSLTGHKKT
ncbi:MAG: selenocysteine-specific translation elongation factor [Gemmataceae bacterium]|nr:selenocysteine-specific translation elongation factor [Gemmataceae bacterium]MDW8243097.1 selenocysteine-specific translation elongation factor [Thermogemmata sp.]